MKPIDDLGFGIGLKANTFNDPGDESDRPEPTVKPLEGWEKVPTGLKAKGLEFFYFKRAKAQGLKANTFNDPGDENETLGGIIPPLELGEKVVPVQTFEELASRFGSNPLSVIKSAFNFAEIILAYHRFAALTVLQSFFK